MTWVDRTSTDVVQETVQLSATLCCRDWLDVVHTHINQLYSYCQQYEKYVLGYVQALKVDLNQTEPAHQVFACCVLSLISPKGTSQHFQGTYMRVKRTEFYSLKTHVNSFKLPDARKNADDVRILLELTTCDVNGWNLPRCGDRLITIGCLFKGQFKLCAPLCWEVWAGYPVVNLVYTTSVDRVQAKAVD